MVTLVLFGVLVAFVGVLLLVFRWQVRRGLAQQAATLQALPPTAIGELAVGARVRVIGTANGTELLKAPYSGAPCLAFHGDRSAALADGRYSQTITGPSSRDVRPFSVEDSTGTIAVDVAHVTLDLALHLTTDEDINKNVFGAKLLARDAVRTSYTEYVLEPAGRVAVIGTVARADDGTLRLAGTPEAPLVVSNHAVALRRADGSTG